MNKTTFCLLALIIVVSIFFRSYNFKKLQYWSGDEEIATAVVMRMINQKTVALISPNSTIGASLGSFFHLLSVPLFLLTNLNPVYVLLFMSITGAITTYIIFYIFETVGSGKMGLVASFFYASSAFISLFDRRWWPLSLNMFLVSLSFLSMIKILQKKYLYLVPLAICISFAFHADPSLSVIGLATLFAFMFFRPNLLRKELIYFLLTGFVFIAPLLIFELRHPGSVINPTLAALNKGSNFSFSLNSVPSKFPNLLDLLGRVYFLKSSTFAESNFCYCLKYEPPFLHRISGLLVILLILYPVIILFKKAKGKIKNLVIISYIYMLAFVIGGVGFVVSYNRELPQHFFMVIFPLLFILSSITVNDLIKNKIILSFILFVYISINFVSLVNTSFRYPLSEKQEIVKKISQNLENSDFSLYIRGDSYFHGGGFTELFILEGKSPKKSYIYYFYDWFYQSNSLYTVKPEKMDQKKIVVIAPLGDNVLKRDKIISNYQLGQIEAIIIDNTGFDFDPASII